ncbi:MAG: protease modulator HflK [Verrucomicrobiota bacterium]
MDKNHHKIGLINWIALLLVTIVGVAISRYLNSAAGLAASFIFGTGFLVALISYFQMRLEERERLEKLEFDELVKSKSSESLFTTQADTFAAKRSREQFERFFIPGFTLLLVLAQGAAIYWQWKNLRTLIPLVETRAAIAISIFGLFALVLFLFGKYSASLARLEKQRLLRPTASYLLLSAYLCALAALSIGLVTWGGIAQADLYAARIFVLLLGVIALELVVSLILEIYRPRIRGKAERLIYESRVVGLLGQPEGVFSSAAHALDYQFGFKVSETWFVRFLQKALAWIIVAQLVVLLLSTCIVFIGTGEQGLLERFGRPVANGVLEPGPHLKLPWPIDEVNRFPTREVQTFNIGFVPDPNLEKEKTVLWTRPHYKEEFNLLVASSEQISTNQAGQQSVPANLLTVSIPVQYQIDDVRAWAYHHADAGQLLEKIATREVVLYLVGVDLIEIMSSGRLKAAQELREKIQMRAHDLKLGVNILFVGLQDIHPPVKVAEEFQKVVGAMQEKEARILNAEGYRARLLPTAEAEAQKKIRDAEIYRLNTVATAVARGAQFTNQITAFTAAPTVYPQRLYLETFARASRSARKYIIAPTNTQDVIQLNLEEKIRPDLLDVTVPPPK